MKLLKQSFYLSNIILIFFYMYPASLSGCLFYNDCQIQPQLTRDFSIFSSNHVYSFIFISFLGFYSFQQKTKIIFYFLIFLSTFLELTHFIIPNRAFELPDLFGNVFGVILSLIIFKIIKTNK